MARHARPRSPDEAGTQLAELRRAVQRVGDSSGRGGRGRRSDADVEAGDDGVPVEDDDLGQVDEDGTWWPRARRQGAALDRRPEGTPLKSRRGAIARTWWSQRFLALADPLVGPEEAARARRHARAGRVSSLVITAGVIEATVARVGAAPARARLSSSVPGPEAWRRVVDELSDRAGHVARLVAGDLPAEIEPTLAVADIDLLPADVGELEATCSCSPWAGGCEHVMAACYLAVETFDADPLALLTWRGARREDLAAVIGRWGRAPVGSEGAPIVHPGIDRDGQDEPRPAVPLPGALATVATGVIVLGGRELADVLAPAYRAMVERAGELARSAGVLRPPGGPDAAARP